MKLNGNNSPVRRQRAAISPYNTAILHLRNPFIVAWWSMAFPGLGYLLLSKYIRAYLLFAWEIIVNLEAHINCAIIYSFTGDFEKAKAILSKEWLLIYITTYIFQICDSYKSTVELNNNFILAAREDANIKPFAMSSLEINYLEKRSPWVSLIWSALSPGTGQLYIQRLTCAFFILFWWLAILYLSKFLPALHLIFAGDFENSMKIIRPQWFLNIPSIYFFSIYDAYSKTVENNKLFDWEQAKYLKNNYQYELFNVPTNLKVSRGENMYIVSTFDHSIYLESAITAIQMMGVPKEDILAIPLDKKAEERRLFDTIHSSDGLSFLDIPLVLACAFTVLGNIYGFMFKWGPIILGLIGAFLGLSLGLLIKLFSYRKNLNKQKQKSPTEVVLIIECNDKQLDMIKDTLWENNALGVRKLMLGEDSKHLDPLV